MESLKWLRKHSELCDIILEDGSCRVPAHSCILASQSAVINGILQSRLTAQKDWSILNPLRIAFGNDGCSADPGKSSMLKELVMFMYGEQISVDKSCVSELIKLSMLLGIGQYFCSLASDIEDVPENNKKNMDRKSSPHDNQNQLVFRCQENNSFDSNDRNNSLKYVSECGSNYLTIVPTSDWNSTADKVSEDHSLSPIAKDTSIFAVNEAPGNFLNQTGTENKISSPKALKKTNDTRKSLQLLKKRITILSKKKTDNSQDVMTIKANTSTKNKIAGTDEDLDMDYDDFWLQKELHDAEDINGECDMDLLHENTNEQLSNSEIGHENDNSRCRKTDDTVENIDYKKTSRAAILCYVCRSKFYRANNLVEHVLMEGHYSQICPLCLIQVDDWEEQREHFSLHNDPLPYFCFCCDLRFRCKADLRMHAPKHSNLKPYSCKECGRGFKWRQAAQAHAVTHKKHCHLLCDICGFSSKYMSTFKSHLHRHLDQFLPCPHPGCTFKSYRKTHLNDHIASHSKLRPHQCEICGHSFSLAKNLKRHMKLHSPDPHLLNCSAISLENCKFQTTRRDKLRFHLSKKHNITYKESDSSKNLRTYSGKSLRTDYYTLVESSITKEVDSDNTECTLDKKKKPLDSNASIADSIDNYLNSSNTLSIQGITTEERDKKVIACMSLDTPTNSPAVLDDQLTSNNIEQMIHNFPVVDFLHSTNINTEYNPNMQFIEIPDGTIEFLPDIPQGELFTKPQSFLLPINTDTKNTEVPITEIDQSPLTYLPLNSIEISYGENISDLKQISVQEDSFEFLQP